MKLKATIIVASLLAATAVHADTIYLKCWAQGLAGDQLNSVYINEQVTVNLDEKTMQSWTFGSNLAVHVTDRCFLRRRLRSATCCKIFFATRPPSGKVSSTASMARLWRINATVLLSAGTASPVIRAVRGADDQAVTLQRAGCGSVHACHQ